MNQTFKLKELICFGQVSGYSKDKSPYSASCLEAKGTKKTSFSSPI